MEKLEINTYISLGMEMIVLILPELFYRWLVRNRSCHFGVLVFCSRMFDLAGEWFGKLAALFSSGVGIPSNGVGIPSAVPASFWPPSRGNLSSGVGKLVRL